MTKMNKALVAIAALSLCAAASATVQPAAQTNLVANGSFETGNFDGWTQFGNTGFTYVSTGGVTDGDYAGMFGPVGSTGGIEQTLALTPGGQYRLSFDLLDGTPGSTFSVNYGGTTLFALNGATPDSAEKHVEFDFTAVAGGQLAFTFENDPSYTYLDNVVATVPESGSTSMLLAGMALLGFAAKRRRQAR